MTSKEIIKRLIAHDEPPRFGYDFKSVSDFKFCASRAYVDLPPNPYNAWGNYPELSLKSGFKGETRMASRCLILKRCVSCLKDDGTLLSFDFFICGQTFYCQQIFMTRMTRYEWIYFNRQMIAKNKAKISKFIAVLPKSGFIAAPEDCLRRPQVFICRMR